MSKIKYRAIDYLWRSWIETINRCKNNPGNSSAIKVSEHIDVYKGKDCVKRFCASFREQIY